MAQKVAAFLRGINVGRAKRIAMADLRTLVEGLGYRNVRTVLNSGNVIFTVPSRIRGDEALRIERAMATRLQVSSRVIVLSASELAVAVEENPLHKVASDPARLLVAVLASPEDRVRLRSMARMNWAPEAFALGPRVAYLWCPDGITRSPVAEAVGRMLGDRVTSRNLATMTKLNALLGHDAE